MDRSKHLFADDAPDRIYMSTLISHAHLGAFWQHFLLTMASHMCRPYVVLFASRSFHLCGSALSLAPVNLGSDVGNTLKLAITQLNASESDHTWIERQGLTDLILNGGIGVVAHDEVLALVVDGLVNASALWKGEGSPVLDAANDTSILKDDRAGSTGKPK